MIPLRNFLLVLAIVLTGACQKAPADAKEPLRALIIDGQNNHAVWPKSTMMMKSYLEETGLFTVDIQRSHFTWRATKWIEQYPLESQPPTEELKDPKTDPNFAPNFSDYDVVISNFGWKAAPLPAATQAGLEKFISEGGALVVVHAANNSWPEWQAYNEMIGLGGWGGRNEESGPYVYYNDAGEKIVDNSPGKGGSHGPQREFQLTTRDADHPIMRGLPAVWMHTQDECYDRLRGPAKNLNILATAYADTQHKGSGRHEPMLMTLTYGEGRIFHTTLGHDDYSYESVGFIITFQRGTEWAATGKVTIDVPTDFPTADQSSSRPFDGP
ncbi:MAG: hypothetical protein SynsKO_43710 [Synoicihabitans sp.]